jgi:serine protease inhibitor
MKKELLESALNEISDVHIAQAIAPKKRLKLYWLGAAAAVIALVLLLNLLPGQSNPLPLPAVHAQAVSLSEGWRSATRDQDFHQWRKEQDQRDSILGSAQEQLSHFFTATSQSVLSDARDNQSYSPANLYIALAMTAEVSDSTTRQQILDALGVSDITALRAQAGAIWETLYTNEKYEKLVLANSLWLDDTLHYDQVTMDALSRHHYASVYRCDLQSEDAGQSIRTWLNENTGDFLKDAVKNVQMRPDTLFALYSTIYFQSRWANEFHPDSNTNDPFYSNQGIRFVTYMNRKKDQMNYYWGDDFGAVYRSLRNGSSMWFILPDDDKSVEDVLESGQFMELVTSEYWYEGWENKKYMLVNLSVPKFDISSQTSLGDDLQKLGISHAFNPEQASFPAIGGGFLTDVNQAVRVAIDEDGVVAAAYTELLAGAAMPPEEIMDFKLDRPFLFVIVKNHIPLFIGVVNEP